jgi:D-sedoheptulose 7-phosphate isomerase
MPQIEHTATAYFQLLGNYLLTSEVTDNTGNAIALNEGCQQAIDMILAAGISGKTMIIGNGGSAAIASHAHNDLSKMVGVKSLVFTEVPLLTALSNDLDYVEAYERQVEMWATTSDLLLAISSSGQSENILRAVRAATTQACPVITFSGFLPDNPLRQMGVLNFYVPSSMYGFVELGHQTLLHFLTDTASVQREQHKQEIIRGKA